MPFLNHGDKGEVLRKALMLREALSAQGTVCGCDRRLLGEEIRCPILKADVERRLVYSVIAEPDIGDAQGDVMSAETIEGMAHNYMLRSRRFDNIYDWGDGRCRAGQVLDSERGYSAPGGKDQGQIVGGRGEGLCRPYLAEGSVKGVSVLHHRRERSKGAGSQIWVRMRI
jgi:hypothetical protein